MATTSKTTKTTSAPAEPISAKLKQVLRTLPTREDMVEAPGRLGRTRDRPARSGGVPAGSWSGRPRRGAGLGGL